MCSFCAFIDCHRLKVCVFVCACNRSVCVCLRGLCVLIASHLLKLNKVCRVYEILCVVVCALCVSRQVRLCVCVNGLCDTPTRPVRSRCVYFECL